MSCCKSLENGWTQGGASEGKTVHKRSVCVCVESVQCTHITRLWLSSSIHPSIHFIFRTPSMDGLQDWSKQKVETYLPGLCFIRILNKHTRSLTMAKHWKVARFLFDLCIHNKGGNATQNACICTAPNGTPCALHWLHLYCTESTRYDGGGNAANGHHFGRNKRIQTKYLLLATFGLQSKYTEFRGVYFTRFWFRSLLKFDFLLLHESATNCR